MKNKNDYFLDANTLVKVIAYHKFSDQHFKQTMTFAKWLEFERSKNYYYKCLQLN